MLRGRRQRQREARGAPQPHMALRLVLQAAAAAAAATAATAGTPIWRRHAGLNCHSSSMPHPQLDGSAVEGDGSMSLAQCQQTCAATPGCSAVTMDVLNLSWTRHVAHNCYTGHGADELIDGSGTVNQCNEMTVPECKTQCVLTAGCTGVVYDTQQDYCCLRANITLTRCDRGDAEWDTHTITSRSIIPVPRRLCRHHRGTVAIGQCDAQSETSDTWVMNEAPLSPWWLSTHFAERSLMLRRYSCDPTNLNARGVCSLREAAQRILPRLRSEGYTVVNVDWPVSASPDSLYEGFGAADYYKVDPLLGTDADWHAFVATAEGLGMKVVADWNPSYFWTGAPAFKTAIADVRSHGLANLPPQSPARWFRWTQKCPGRCTTVPTCAPHPSIIVMATGAGGDNGIAKNQKRR
jgi:hypothetical protein